MTMLAQRTSVLRNLVSVNATRSFAISISTQGCSRNLHTRVGLKPLKYSSRSGLSEVFFSKHHKHERLAGFFIISRNDSTATAIPPLTSEVFSKQVDSSHVASSSPSPTMAASSGTSTTETILTTASAENPVSSQSNITSASAVEPAAETTVSEQSLTWEAIPEPPALPVEELTKVILSANGEPTFASLGLGGWTPSGIVQQLLEYVHVEGLPWWLAIVLGTVCVRLLVFPLVIKSQRNAAKMSNNMPQMQALQLKMSEARQTGNALMAAKYGQDLMLFMKEKEISPFKNLLVPLAMAPIFISFFFGLRKMANLPVESMKEGGLFWFTDLTMCDPYYILPLMTSVTLWITMEVGVDGVQLNASTHGQLMRYAIRAIPLIMFPLTMNFPAAILCYWVSTNAVSLCQVTLLKIPAIRSSLKIDPIRKFTPEQLPIKKKKFMESLKESWTNVKISKEMEDRTRYDEMTFRRAGRGPIPKTYKYDPTKVPPANAIQAKKQ